MPKFGVQDEQVGVVYLVVVDVQNVKKAVTVLSMYIGYIDQGTPPV